MQKVKVLFSLHINSQKAIQKGLHKPSLSLSVPLFPSLHVLNSVLLTVLDSGASVRPDALLYHSAAVTITSCSLAQYRERQRLSEGKQRGREKEPDPRALLHRSAEAHWGSSICAGHGFLSFLHLLECQRWISCFEQDAAGQFGMLRLSKFWVRLLYLSSHLHVQRFS